MKKRLEKSFISFFLVFTFPLVHCKTNNSIILAPLGINDQKLENFIFFCSNELDFKKKIDLSIVKVYTRYLNCPGHLYRMLLVLSYCRRTISPIDLCDKSQVVSKLHKKIYSDYSFIHKLNFVKV